ncbi:MAG: hypothetical protein ACOZIN_14400 [Myxococcota bacterium]
MARFFDFLKATLFSPANLISLAAGGAAAATLHDPTPVYFALGAQGLYLALLGTSPGFRRWVLKTADVGEAPATGRKELETLASELAASQREHYLALSELRDRILDNYRRLPGGPVLVAASEQKVDALLGAFLRLLSTLNTYRRYLSATDRKSLEQEIDQLRAEAAAEENSRVQEVKRKRVEILQKRVQRFVQVEESRELVSHQLAGIEDLLRLTHEQSIAIRDPESVSRQLDALAAEVTSTEETVRELEQFMELGEETGATIPQGTRVR